MLTDLLHTSGPCAVSSVREKMTCDERRTGGVCRLNPTVGMILLELQAFNHGECARVAEREPPSAPTMVALSRPTLNPAPDHDRDIRNQ